MGGGAGSSVMSTVNRCPGRRASPAGAAAAAGPAAAEAAAECSRARVCVSSVAGGCRAGPGSGRPPAQPITQASQAQQP